MAQTNFTPILLYASSTPTNVPTAGNLTNSATGSEIAINIADKNLFFKDSGGVVNTVPIRQSSTSSNGWLSSADWNTFNNKSNTNGTVTSVAALTIGTTGTDLSSTVANGTTTPVITLNVPTASAANRGALSAADWSTFNSKQATLVSGTNIKTVGGVTLLGSGDVGTIGVAYGGTGLTSLTAGRIPYGAGTSAFSSSANFYFDGTNLGVGTSSPGNILHLAKSTAANTFLQATNSLATSFYGVDGAGAAYCWNGNAYPILFGTNGTEKMRLFSSGGVSIGNTTDPGAGNLRFTTSGTNGIYFGSSSRLDVYEIGNYTPTATAASGSITSYTSYGSYTKVGQMVTVQVQVIITNAGTGSGGLNISLPYATKNVTGNFAANGREIVISGSTLGAQIAPNTSTATVLTYANSTIVVTNASVVMSFTYPTN